MTEELFSNTSVSAQYRDIASSSQKNNWKLLLFSPLGTLLEYCFKSIFGVVHRLRYQKLRKTKQLPLRDWKPLNERLTSPISIAYLMTYAPRWNMSAQIFSHAPFFAQTDISIDTLTLRKTAKAWCIVIYNFRDRKIVRTVSSNDNNQHRFETPIPSDFYSIIVRVYDPQAHFTLPAVYSGGMPTIAEMSQIKKYDIDLLGRCIFYKNSILYKILHSPTLKLIRNSNIDAKIKIHRFLPAGSPETLYIFGPIYNGDLMLFDTTETRSFSCLIYVTIYNSSCFPEHSETIVPGDRLNIPCGTYDGSYLVRVVPTGIERNSTIDKKIVDSIRIETDPRKQVEG